MTMLPYPGTALRNVLFVIPGCSLCANNQPFHSIWSCSQSQWAWNPPHQLVFSVFPLPGWKYYMHTNETIAFPGGLFAVYLEGGTLFRSQSGIEKRWRPPSLSSLCLIKLRCGLALRAAAYVKICFQTFFFLSVHNNFLAWFSQMRPFWSLEAGMLCLLGFTFKFLCSYFFFGLTGIFSK